MLTLLWLTPVIGAIVIVALPATMGVAVRWIAVAASTLVLVQTVILAVRFAPDGDRYQFVESHSWITAFGTRYALGMDGIALVLVGLTAVLLPLLVIAGWNDADTDDAEPTAPGRATHRYLALMLLVEAMVIVAFTSLDILLFYIFFEAMLIPMYFLIAGFGGTGTADAAADSTRRSRAAVKFLLYNLAGGLAMLAAVVGVFVVTADRGTGTFDLRAIVARVASGDLSIDPTTEKLLFLGFMVAFAVKAPLWPLHTWLPDAAAQTTPAAAVLMMAVVDKVGTFAMLRYCIELFPDATRFFTPAIVTLAVIGIVYGAVMAIASTDVMRLIAYTSISHFGFIILGVFASTSQGLTGATLYMFSHGIATAALMLVAGFLVSRRGSRAISDFGGVAKVAPVLAGTFLVAGLATLSLPGMAPFISEFLVFIGTFTRYPVAAVCASAALVLAAVYILWMYQRMMTGPLAPGNEKLPDLRRREIAVMTPLIALLLVFGFYPRLALDVIDPAVHHTLTTVDRPDPTPAVAESGATVPDGGTR